MAGSSGREGTRAASSVICRQQSHGSAGSPGAPRSANTGCGPAGPPRRVSTATGQLPDLTASDLPLQTPCPSPPSLSNPSAPFPRSRPASSCSLQPRFGPAPHSPPACTGSGASQVFLLLGFRPPLSLRCAQLPLFYRGAGKARSQAEFTKGRRSTPGSRRAGYVLHITDLQKPSRTSQIVPAPCPTRQRNCISLSYAGGVWLETPRLQLQELMFALRKLNHATRGTAPPGSARGEGGFAHVWKRVLAALSISQGLRGHASSGAPAPSRDPTEHPLRPSELPAPISPSQAEQGCLHQGCSLGLV